MDEEQMRTARLALDPSESTRETRAVALVDISELCGLAGKPTAKISLCKSVHFAYSKATFFNH